MRDVACERSCRTSLCSSILFFFELTVAYLCAVVLFSLLAICITSTEVKKLQGTLSVSVRPFCCAFIVVVSLSPSSSSLSATYVERTTAGNSNRSSAYYCGSGVPQTCVTRMERKLLHGPTWRRQACPPRVKRAVIIDPSDPFTVTDSLSVVDVRYH